MSNKYADHLFVLPEDDANRQIANGFILHYSINQRNIQVLPPSGGWKKVIEEFETKRVPEMRSYSLRRMVLVLDLDDRGESRLEIIKLAVPSDLANRVFVLGVLSEPERLKVNLGCSLEKIGTRLSQDCAENTRETWGHDLLRHNETELVRLISLVKPFLFNG